VDKESSKNISGNMKASGDMRENKDMVQGRYADSKQYSGLREIKQKKRAKENIADRSSREHSKQYEVALKNKRDWDSKKQRAAQTYGSRKRAYDRNSVIKAAHKNGSMTKIS